jgi:hypothetical protein
LQLSNLGMIGCWTMSVMPVVRLAAALVAANVPLPLAAAPLPATPPLEALAATIGDLKASLSTIREQMEAMRAAPESAALRPPAQACPAGVADAASGPSAWQHAKAAMTAELISTRERVAAAEAAAASLQTDRQRLVQRITELDQMLAKARTSEVVDGLVEQRRVTFEPIEAEPARSPDADGEISAIAAPELLRVARPALAGEAYPVLQPTGGRDLARAGKRLDLEAELALAQLRIAELSTALQAARMRQEAMAAEVTTLRSLTSGQIERFMGRAD